MATATTPVKLTISLSEVAKTALPAEVEARLQSSPEAKSAEEQAAAELRAANLRSAYLEAVKDRAARETQRALDAAARKLRLAAAKTDKLQRKSAAHMSHAEAKKAADAAERDARKIRNRQAFEAVAEAREAAAAARLARQHELAQAVTSASVKHSRNIQAIVDKSSLQVKHAADVVESRKARDMAKEAEAAERLEAKLCRAALSRAARLSKEASPVTSPKKAKSDGASPPKKAWGTPLTAADPAARFRVLNEAKVASETLRRSLDASMAKAESKREAALRATVDRASADTAKAAKIVAAQHAKARGEDKEIKAAKASLYEKMINAEVQRLTHLKQRAADGTKPAVLDGVVAIPGEPARAKLSAALALRLAATPTALLDSAVKRQEGAAARRAARTADLVRAAAAATARRAACLARVQTRATALKTKLEQRDARAVIALARDVAARALKTGLATARARAAAEVRAAAKDAKGAKGVAAVAGWEAARARAHAKTRAKAGEAARRQAAFVGRREAGDAVRAAAGAKEAAKAAEATARRAALLEAVVAKAKLLGKKASSEA